MTIGDMTAISMIIGDRALTGGTAPCVWILRPPASPSCDTEVLTSCNSCFNPLQAGDRRSEMIEQAGGARARTHVP